MSSGFEMELILSRPYLTRKQITRAQRNTIPDLRVYTQKKLQILGYLSDLCVYLMLPRRTLETTIYYYDRYHLFNAFETEMVYALATGCLLLSCKQTETIKKLNDICIASFRVRKVPNVTTEMVEAFRKRAFQLELRILEACSFDYRINNFLHIDEYIVKVGKKMECPRDVCYVAWLIAYDVLKTDIMLVVPQHSIAVAALKISEDLLKTKHVQWNSEVYNELSTDIHSVSEAYFEVVNFYINMFDSCELRGNIMPSQIESVPDITLKSFIDLKQDAGPQRGLNEVSNELIDRDLFLAIDMHSQTVRERRHVLSRRLVTDEQSSLQ